MAATRRSNTVCCCQRPIRAHQTRLLRFLHACSATRGRKTPQHACVVKPQVQRVPNMHACLVFETLRQRGKCQLCPRRGAVRIVLERLCQRRLNLICWRACG
jgi:hypothetical protein